MIFVDIISSIIRIDIEQLRKAVLNNNNLLQLLTMLQNFSDDFSPPDNEDSIKQVITSFNEIYHNNEKGLIFEEKKLIFL